MSYPTVSGRAVEGPLYREAQMCLGTKWANSYYQFYLTGTTTPANVYQNGILTTAFPTTGKVTSDAYGRFAPIYLDTSVTYRVRFFNSANVQQWQVDPYVPPLATVGTSSNIAYGINIALTGEVVIPSPTTGGSGISLTLNAGALGSAAIRLIGTLAGNSAVIVNSSVTTGAQTATFAATNKPGTATSSPAGWLPITCDGVQYYTPIWHSNNFTPYVANPGALGEVINSSTVTFGGSGLTTVGSGSAVPPNWFAPTTPGIGAGYYINITRTGGTPGVNFSAAQGAWTNIGAGGLTINPSPSGTVTGTYQLSSNSGGAPIVAAGTINLAPFSGTSHIYTSGSGTETIPSGATTLTIEVWGGVSGGGGGSLGNGSEGGGGGGGAGPAYSRSVYTVSGNSGQTMTYTVGAAGGAGANIYSGVAGNGTAGGASSVSPGTFAMSAMSSSAGGGGTGGTNVAAGTGGTASAASGGNVVNQAGGAGGTPTFSSHGAGAAGTYYGTPLHSGTPSAAGNNSGGDGFGDGAGTGSTGIVSFYYV